MSPPTWTTRDGQRLPLSSMTEEHLRNVLAMLERHAKECDARECTVVDQSDGPEYLPEPEQRFPIMRSIREELARRKEQ